MENRKPGRKKYDATILNRFEGLYKNICIYFFVYLFLCSNSVLNAATLTSNNGFESGNLSGLRCSGNCPSVVTSPTAGSKYSGNFILTRNMDIPYRTEAVLERQHGHFDFGKEYWVGLNYRYEDWNKDSSNEMAPFQVHTRASDWSKACHLGSAAGTAPFYMASANDEVRFATYGGKVLWRGEVEKKQWLNVVIHFRISAGSDGFVEAWKDGIKLGRVDGQNSPKMDNCGKPMKTPFLKTGIYKWDWKAGRAATASTRRQIFIDNIKIAEGMDGYSLINPTQDSTPEEIDMVAPIISNIQAAVTDITATITWNTSKASASLVRYGMASSYGLSANNTVLVTSHKVTLKNLEAGKLYYYQVISKDSNGNTGDSSDLTFTTKSLRLKN